ncbi:MAG: hypothetical protein MZV70_10830, partial [Desulfobacterales bacterium]|nr:hypothetical protein [Desulfobacterales bacterium]
SYVLLYNTKTPTTSSAPRGLLPRRDRRRRWSRTRASTAARMTAGRPRRLPARVGRRRSAQDYRRPRACTRSRPTARASRR